MSNLKELQKKQNQRSEEKKNEKQNYSITKETLARKNEISFRPGMDAEKIKFGNFAPFTMIGVNDLGKGVFYNLADELQFLTPPGIFSSLKYKGDFDKTQSKKKGAKNFKRKEEHKKKFYGDEEKTVTISFPDTEEKANKFLEKFPELQKKVDVKQWVADCNNFSLFIKRLHKEFCDQVEENEACRKKGDEYDQTVDFFSEKGQLHKRMGLKAKGGTFKPENDEKQNVFFWCSVNGFPDRNGATDLYTTQYQEACKEAGTKDLPMNPKKWVNTMRVYATPQVKREIDAKDYLIPQDDWEKHLKNGALVEGLIGFKGIYTSTTPTYKQAAKKITILQLTRNVYNNENEIGEASRAFVIDDEEKENKSDDENGKNENENKQNENNQNENENNENENNESENSESEEEEEEKQEEEEKPNASEFTLSDDEEEKPEEEVKIEIKKKKNENILDDINKRSKDKKDKKVKKVKKGKNQE